METVRAANDGRVSVKGFSIAVLVWTYIQERGVTSTLQVASSSVWYESL